MKFFTYLSKTALCLCAALGCAFSQTKPFSEKEAKPLFYGQHDTFSENRSLGSGFSKNTDSIEGLFAGSKIKNVESINDLEGKPGFLYVDFEEQGYAILFTDTLEVLERSSLRRVDWKGDPSSWCYGGPGYYFVKEGSRFYDFERGFVFDISEEDAATFSQNLRQKLSNKAPLVQDRLTQSNTTDPKDNRIAISKGALKSAPSIDTGNLISLLEGTLIPNYKYFTSKPFHGENNNDTCAAVASQLLLGYHNFFSERRLIKDYYLFGDPVYYPERNPNYCPDPMSMTQYTTGTTSGTDPGLTPMSYYQYVNSAMPSTGFLPMVKYGIGQLIDYELDGTDDEGNYALSYSLSNWFGTQTINTDLVRQEINKGRPSIILLQASLGAINHYVTAYGFADYCYPNSQNTYSGFITHFGWDDEKTNVWVNSIWICGYITLKFNHVHNYYEVGPIENTDRTEWKCTECGHRTDCVLMIGASERHRELFLTISEDGPRCREFYVIFENTKKRMFQTFGPNDMELTLHSFDGQQLASGGDDGSFGVNAFFIYEVSSGTPYWLRTGYHSQHDHGPVKIGITPVAVSYPTYNEILYLTGGGCTWNSVANTVYAVCFKPPLQGTYNILVYYPGGNYDTYLQVINPASFSPCWSAGDASPSYQTGLTLNLLRGRRYLLLASLKNISQYGFMGLSITRISP